MQPLPSSQPSWTLPSPTQRSAPSAFSTPSSVDGSVLTDASDPLDSVFVSPTASVSPFQSASPSPEPESDQTAVVILSGSLFALCLLVGLAETCAGHCCPKRCQQASARRTERQQRRVNPAPDPSAPDAPTSPVAQAPARQLPILSGRSLVEDVIASQQHRNRARSGVTMVDPPPPPRQPVAMRTGLGRARAFQPPLGVARTAHLQVLARSPGVASRAGATQIGATGSGRAIGSSPHAHDGQAMLRGRLRSSRHLSSRHTEPVTITLAGPATAVTMPQPSVHRNSIAAAAGTAGGTAGAGDGGASSRSADRAGRTCVICLDDHATVAIIPCGHVCLCSAKQCAGAFSRQSRSDVRCPLCREAVQGLAAPGRDGRAAQTWELRP
jgi:hypothetical protein